MHVPEKGCEGRGGRSLPVIHTNNRRFPVSVNQVTCHTVNLHGVYTNTASCTTGWVNYANEPSQAELEWSIQDAYDVMRLTRSEAAVWASRRCGAFDRNFLKRIPVYFLPSVAYDPEG